MLEHLRAVTGAKSDADLSRATGMSKGDLSRILHGVRGGDMRLSTLVGISSHTGVRVGELAEWWAETEAPAREPRPGLAIDRLWHAKLASP